ncbi:hypothetical protein ElyMa_002779800 [Elysia marginata]|uniref:Uncharacterized protein n=1 Tax=Elysia marginata TaxID=1093978 RepID=A0AAV4HKY2_9GAST|nr:hypothetical protein ElyMa_002779800 [Elysia marginata]
MENRHIDGELKRIKVDVAEKTRIVDDRRLHEIENTFFSVSVVINQTAWSWICFEKEPLDCDRTPTRGTDRLLCLRMATLCGRAMIFGAFASPALNSTDEDKGRLYVELGAMLNNTPHTELIFSLTVLKLEMALTLVDGL